MLDNLSRVYDSRLREPQIVGPPDRFGMQILNEAADLFGTRHCGTIGIGVLAFCDDFSSEKTICVPWLTDGSDRSKNLRHVAPKNEIVRISSGYEDSYRLVGEAFGDNTIWESFYIPEDPNAESVTIFSDRPSIASITKETSGALLEFTRSGRHRVVTYKPNRSAAIWQFGKFTDLSSVAKSDFDLLGRFRELELFKSVCQKLI